MTSTNRWLVAAASFALVAGTAVAEDSAATSKATAEHEMTGRVSRLDKSAGTVTIDVPGSSDIELRLPPEDIAGFREGDEVVVSMGMREARPSDRPARSDEQDVP
jgi:hypothetical protein